MKINIEATTDGKGKNTDEERMVRITDLGFGFTNIALFPDDYFQGELRAFFEPHGFTPGSWNVVGHGFICGDKQWLKQFKAGLRDAGFSIKAAANTKYSELERHGNNYVSLDIGPNFYKSYKRLISK